MALTDNLVSYWKMEDVNDAVGSRTLTNNNTVTFTSGKVNNAGSFNGSNQYLSRASDSGLQITGALTIAFWIYCDTLTGTQAIVAKSNGDISNYEFEISRGSSGQLSFTSSNASNYFNAYTGNSLITASSWYFVVMRKSGNVNGTDTITFRVNGSNNTTTVGSANISNVGTSTYDFTIGRRGGGTAQYFDGLIDEVGIWNKNMSDAEADQLYNSGSGTTYPFGTNYHITVVQGSYTLTGQATGLLQGLKMLGAYATYAYTGFDTIFKLGKGFAADFGSYVVTGNDTLFSKVISMVASYGSYALTGFGVTIQKGISIVVTAGSYVLTGFNARFPRFWTNIAKSVTSWINNTKNSTTWNNQDKTDI